MLGGSDIRNIKLRIPTPTRTDLGIKEALLSFHILNPLNNVKATRTDSMVFDARSPRTSL